MAYMVFVRTAWKQRCEPCLKAKRFATLGAKVYSVEFPERNGLPTEQRISPLGRFCSKPRQGRGCIILNVRVGAALDSVNTSTEG